jgi:pantothenate synthetase
MRDVLDEHGLQIDYAVVRDAETLMHVESFARPIRALIAARVGQIRLIDNDALSLIHSATAS